MSELREAMLDLAGDDIDTIALMLGKAIGWGNGAVFGSEDERCDCPRCEQERDDVRVVILSAVAPVLARLRSEQGALTPGQST
jgi:hypothetical protein